VRDQDNKDLQLQSVYFQLSYDAQRSYRRFAASVRGNALVYRVRVQGRKQEKEGNTKLMEEWVADLAFV